jgi:UDPglucose--hexose-1-phosphate uridylyltransferase
MGYDFVKESSASRLSDTAVSSASAECPMIEATKPNVQTNSASPSSQHAGESRFDPVTGNWTLFAPHRSERPDEFVESRERIRNEVECPFCPGNETTTPPAVWIGQSDSDIPITDKLQQASTLLPQENASQEAASQEAWAVRVVPNKFPAVTSVKESSSKSCTVPERTTAKSASQSGLFQRRPIAGGHEVIIESRNHVQSITDLDVAEAALVFKAYRDRLLYWRDVPGIAYISIFKNVGSKAGASLRHTHSQLIATDRMPPMVSAAAERMSNYRLTQGSCLHCDLVRAELKAKERIIWRDDDLVAFCPFSSHLPFLVRITTMEHQSCYADLSDSIIESVSRLVRRVVSWIEQLHPGTAYNFCLHTRPPACNDPSDAYHWGIEIFPRITQIAGFEFSSHCMINPILPEDAATKLRGCALAEDPRLIL